MGFFGNLSNYITPAVQAAGGIQEGKLEAVKRAVAAKHQASQDAIANILKSKQIENIDSEIHTRENPKETPIFSQDNDPFVMRDGKLEPVPVASTPAIAPPAVAAENPSAPHHADQVTAASPSGPLQDNPSSAPPVQQGTQQGGSPVPVKSPGPKFGPRAPQDPVKVHEANRQFDVAHPLPEPVDRTLVPVQGADAVIYKNRSAAEGMNAPSPNARGSAAIQKDIATNRTQMTLIDRAMDAVSAHPTAFGGKRALGDVVPLMGGVSDYINQRADPEGVDARALVANISSLQIKDRSGAAVTVSEFPRLAPFVPRVGDTPETIRKKLVQLKAAIEIETGFLQQGAGAPRATGGPPGDINLGSSHNQQLWDAAVAKYGKVVVLKRFGPRPAQ